MIEFECGCKFEKDKNGFLKFNPNIESLRLDCEGTWDMICDGNTKGVFQLESQLGQSKAKQVAPRSIEELSDLVAIIRPGCGDAIVKGKSLTQHYIDRKAGLDPVEYEPDVRLKPILEPTYGILVYQEQAMQIAQLVAGFSLQQADNLRKAIGKKNVELMAKVKSDFLKGAEESGDYTERDAEEIFSWIEKSQKYSFNKSHSISYALNAYQTAYAKYHFSDEFFTSYLRHAKDKQKPFIEVAELVNNAKIMSIDVNPPSVKNMNARFSYINDRPTFGIVDIKNVGQSVYDKLYDYIENKGLNIEEMNWEQFLMRCGRHIKSNSFKSMIVSGALDCYKVDRNEMLHHFSIYKELKDNDKVFLEECQSKSLVECISQRVAWVMENQNDGVNRRKKLSLLEGSLSSIEHPPYSLKDSWGWRAKGERDNLGIEVTCYELDEYNFFGSNCTCREYYAGFSADIISIAARVDDIREWKIRGGQHKGEVMAFLKISDSTCALDNVTVFSDDWAKIKKNTSIGSFLMLKGERDKKRGSFLVKRVQKLKQCI